MHVVRSETPFQEQGFGIISNLTYGKKSARRRIDAGFFALPQGT